MGGGGQVAGEQKGIDASLNPVIATTTGTSSLKGFEPYLSSVQNGQIMDNSKGDVQPGKVANDTRNEELWKTPDQVHSVLSDCPIGVNKFYNLIEEESNHSKWLEFRKMALKDPSAEECSNLLMKMELEASDEEDVIRPEEEEEEELFSLEETGILPGNIEEIEEKLSGKGATKKNQKRKTGWGPILRAPRPRRYPEDGRTIMEKAQDLKKIKNLEKGKYLKKSFASEDNATLLNKASCVNITLGTDYVSANETIDSLKSKELEDRLTFEENNPEVNLPDSLESVFVDKEFPPLAGSSNSPERESNLNSDISWVQIASKGKGENILTINNDRGILEC